MANGMRLRGPMYVAPWAADKSTLKFLPLGNCTSGQINHQTSDDSIPDFLGLGGGQADVYTEVTGVSLDLKLSEAVPANFALAMSGTASVAPAGAIQGEAHRAYRGAFMPFALLAAGSVVVKNGAATVPPAQYSVTPHGVLWAADAAAISADGDEVTVDYTPAGQHRIDAVVNANAVFCLLVAGFNQAAAGTAVNLLFNRVTIPAASQLAIMQEKFLEIPLKIGVTADATAGAGLSRFYRMLVAQ